MTYSFRPAVRTETSLLIALAGSSGSGKTFSALRLARGLVGATGKIAFIDTEAGRALHYADRFKFDHCELAAPFRPQRYIEAIKAAEAAKYNAIVIDSMSHVWAGHGGCVEWAEELAGGNKPEVRHWIQPKTAHKKLVNDLLQCRSHLLFCLRAEEKIKMEKDEKGKTQVVPIGWQPICEKNFMFEQTASFMLHDSAPGVPVPIKVQDQHKAAFPAGQQITERCGELLAEWARGGAPRPVVTPPSATDYALVDPETGESRSLSGREFLAALGTAMKAGNAARWWKENSGTANGLVEDAARHGEKARDAAKTTVDAMRKLAISNMAGSCGPSGSTPASADVHPLDSGGESPGPATTKKDAING